MKTIILIMTFFSFQVGAVETSTNSSSQSPQAKATTEHNFEDILVQGKYHFSDESVTTVEEDKVLDSLIGVRSDFKDRLKQSSDLY